jgi:tRNA-splicing ligase RtcB
MADGHVGYHMPIGGVAAYRNRINVAGVGVDIACGNAAIRTDLRYDAIVGREEELADEIFNTIEFGIGRTNKAEDAPVDLPLFEDARFFAIPGAYREKLRQMARNQLGTVGSGNHYVDVFVDVAGRIWVGVHFGSRGFGFNISNGFTQLFMGGNFESRKGMYNTVASYDLDSPLGHDFWNAMELAGEYAYLGREWVARKVVGILGGHEEDLVHNHHNFAWKETHLVHDGQDFYEELFVVIRKGATPAWPGQRGFVGGSMGDNSVILRGAENAMDDVEEEATVQAMAAMYSTVHGAGRVLSRKRAKREVDQAEVEAWLRDKEVVVRGGDLDESPQAYRRLPEVIEAQGQTIEVLEILMPKIVCMAGKDVFDPYKD